MIPHQFATSKIPRWLYACLCAALLCSFFGVASDTRAQLTVNQVCTALDVSTDNCSQIRSVSFDPPNFPWLLTTDTSVVGSSSLRSGDIDHNQQSCIVLGLSLPVNAVLSVAARTSSEGLFDQLQIGADNLRLDTISGRQKTPERDWRLENYFLPTAISTLSWCYVKNRRDLDSIGLDTVWIDNLSFSTSDIPYQSRVCDALDITDNRCALIQSVTYEPPQLLWIITSATATAGRTSLRSADIDDDERTCLNLALVLPIGSRVRFSRQDDLESPFDALFFETDNSSVFVFTNSSRGWQVQTLILSGDSRTVSWCYVKDNALSEGNDSLWIDAVTFISGEVISFCDALDLPFDRCELIRSVSYDPPQNPWRTTTTDFIGGDSALVSPLLETGQSTCLTLDIDITLPSGSYLAFAWRITSPSDQDIFEFQSVSQLRNMPQWQTETVDFNDFESTLSWCYRKNSPAGSQTARAWLDRLLAVTPDDRYIVQIAVTDTPTTLAMRPDSFQFQVSVTAQSPLLPTPADWVLIASSIDNISGADSTYALVFSGNSAQVDVTVTPDNPLLPSSLLLALEDRPLLRGVAVTSLTVQLPARQLGMLDIVVADTVTQTAIDAAIEIAVTVNAEDSLGFPVAPRGLTLMVSDSGNADVPQSSYALTFAGGTAQTTITVGLTARGSAGSIEVSVIGGSIESTARITLNPAPRILVSITLSAVSSSLVQTMANTPVMAELILTALDNYGDPIEAGNISLQLSASNDAVVQSSLTVAVETSGIAQQAVEILPQNDRDTTVTVQILRGNLDEALQLLPDGGIQIAVRALRVLRQLQLSLAGTQSPLRQIDQSQPIRANIRLIGLDQYDQPIAFPEIMLTATADPSTTQVTLNPPQVAATEVGGAMTELEVTFSETLLDTTITIAVTSPAPNVTAEDLVLRALPDRRPPLPSLNVDNADLGVTALDLIVAMRWLTDQQQGNSEALVANLAIDSASITAAGINNLQQLFNENSNRVDLNKDGRADQLDLRILLRWLSGLRGAELAEQEVVEDIIRLLLGKPPISP